MMMATKIITDSFFCRLPHLALSCGGCLPLLVLILGVFFALPILLLEATVGQLTRSCLDKASFSSSIIAGDRI